MNLNRWNLGYKTLSGDMAYFGMFSPIGSEGYDFRGNLISSIFSEGWVASPSGQVVFKTAIDYGDVPIFPGRYEVLTVAGGGGAGSTTVYLLTLGGGGGGGVLYNSSFLVSSSVAKIQVGEGGLQGASTGKNGTNGGNSVFSTQISLGGGASKGGSKGAGANGGSGGGGAGSSGPAGLGEAGPPRQGYNGGKSSGSNSGSGGGAGEIGKDNGGTGANGVEYFGTYYAGGGAGSVYAATISGGTGGGGASAFGGKNGTNYLGGGGGGMYSNGALQRGGNGGSGIVIIRWGGYSYNYDPTA